MELGERGGVGPAELAKAHSIDSSVMCTFARGLSSCHFFQSCSDSSEASSRENKQIVDPCEIYF